MLNIFYGDMKEAVYNTASYFKYDYEEGWIVDPMVKEMIQDVDKSVVIDSGIIDSPVLGKIPPIGLSGGVKTLILVKFEPEKVFNVSIWKIGSHLQRTVHYEIERKLAPLCRINSGRMEAVISALNIFLYLSSLSKMSWMA